MTTTDTPRTDAETYVWQDGGENPFVHRDFARQLERELKRANDEIEFYEKIGQEKVDELRASKAEVERLKETLEFIAADDSEHDSTAYYRAIANQTLRLLIK